jgi:succinate dehydrogenase/fumarate reductase flavoprotein subunit
MTPKMAFSQQPNDNENLKVLIVGAGIAGLASVKIHSFSLYHALTEQGNCTTSAKSRNSHS